MGKHAHPPARARGRDRSLPAGARRDAAGPREAMLLVEPPRPFDSGSLLAGAAEAVGLDGFTRLARAVEQYRSWRLERRWRRLRALGMQLGRGVNLPMSTWIDTSHCHLISIGDHCGFGDGCLILAHDAMPNEFLDATRVGRVTIHPSCHFGARTVILPGVEIGPRTIVGAGSVVSRSLPPHSVAAGNPARVLCSLDEYLERHRQRLATAPTFAYEESDIERMSPPAREQMRQRLARGDGYIVGGTTAARAGRGRNRVT